jgi:hypothetical protein
LSSLRLWTAAASTPVATMLQQLRQHLLSTIADERGLISKIRARHGTRNELSFNRLTDGDSARAKPRP